MNTAQLDLPIGSLTEERFRAFHRKHPIVYKELINKARVLKKRGYRHYSVDVLLHVVRFGTAIAVDGADGLKIDNNYSSLYARLVMSQEPDLAGFLRPGGSGNQRQKPKGKNGRRNELG